MATWLAIIRAALEVLARGTEIFRDRQLLDAGEAQAVARTLQIAMQDIERMRRARRAARALPPERLRDDDGFRRD